MHHSLRVLSLAALAAAVPLGARDGYDAQGKPPGFEKGQKYESTFDDLDPSLNSKLSADEIGPYNGLEYNGINLATLGLEGNVIAGIVPRSAPNAAGYSARTTDEGETPEITTQYAGSVTDTYDFESFYFGCAVDSIFSLAGAPTGCTVTVSGFKASKEVARQEFEFKPGLLAVKADMIKAKLNKDFKGIDTATFYSEYDVSVVGITFLDNLKYTTYAAKDKKEQGKEGKEGEGEKKEYPRTLNWSKWQDEDAEKPAHKLPELPKEPKDKEDKPEKGDKPKDDKDPKEPEELKEPEESKDKEDKDKPEKEPKDDEGKKDWKNITEKFWKSWSS